MRRVPSDGSHRCQTPYEGLTACNSSAHRRVTAHRRHATNRRFSFDPLQSLENPRRTMTHAFAKPLSALPSGALRGRVAVPGDKSISHRSLMLGALTIGETKITRLLESADIMATAAAMRAFGAKLERSSDGIWHVHGLGTGGLLEPEGVIDFGNAGTGVRLASALPAHMLLPRPSSAMRRFRAGRWRVRWIRSARWAPR